MHLSQIPPALRALEQEQRLRVPDDDLLAERLKEAHGDAFLDAATNDYLGLGRTVSRETARGAEGASPLAEPELPAACAPSPSPSALAEPGALAPTGPAPVSRETGSRPSAPAPGARASRLVFGSSREHLAVETEVAAWLEAPAALLFSSGYAANVGALSALLSAGDAVFSDSLNHASLIDGIRLSRAEPSVYPHLDLDALEAGLRGAAGAPARWVVTESYYSMDGDGPDLKRLRALCDRYDAALYVDEAHSLGAFGPEGAGLCRQAGVRAEVLAAAFGKAVGSHGACIVSSPDVRTWLWNRARSFVYSTAPSPAHCASLLIQIERTRSANPAREALARVSERVRAALTRSGIPTVAGSFGPVVAVLVGTEGHALSAAERLRNEGILAAAIRPPTVPPGECRLRLILTAHFTDAQTDRLALSVSRAVAESQAAESQAAEPRPPEDS